MKGKELTGEEVGRLIIKDLIAMYNEFRTGHNLKKYKGLFTKAEREKLVDSIPNTQYDISMYRSYRKLHEIISNTSANISHLLKEYEATTYRLLFIISEYDHDVMNRHSRNLMPKIVDNMRL